LEAIFAFDDGAVALIDGHLIKQRNWMKEGAQVSFSGYNFPSARPN
jgi:hypothetical protein